jgi:hypothetical protein
MAPILATEQSANQQPSAIFSLHLQAIENERLNGINLWKSTG